MESIVDKVKSQIEELLYENAADFEIAKVLKKDIKLYFDTLEETFTTSGGKDFLVKHLEEYGVKEPGVTKLTPETVEWRN